MSKLNLAISIRQKLTAAFVIVSLLIALVALSAIKKQFETIERAALLEAEHLATSVANTGMDDVLNKPKFLQDYINGMHNLYKRDIGIVDIHKRGVADADVKEVNQIFQHDPDNEVGKTIIDGKVRTFVELNALHAEGAKQIVVALRKDQSKLESPIVGAVILEYTQIYDELLDAAKAGLYFVIVTGIALVLFSTIFGTQVARRITRRLRELERMVSIIAAGNYSTRVPVQAADEIGSLGNAVNKMAEALALSHARQSEHAHELEQSNALLKQEVHEHQISAEKNETLAYYDSLTSLPNRILFGKLLDHSLVNARRYDKEIALFFIDLDRFKYINDTLGHEAGDELLQEIGTRIKSCLRESDAVARFGGDEFVVLVSELDEIGRLDVVARKILGAIGKSFMLVGHEFRVTASIGIATFPAAGQDAQSLLKNADIAMYQAKKEGKNNFILFSEALNTNSLQQLALESSLRHALERGEFELHYQAKVDSRSDSVTGMEALLRWNHPDLGMVAPMQFIPLAEETGLIVEIGKWVLRTACMQNVVWQTMGIPALTMAVNLSARQFSDAALLEDITSILEQTGMEPALLELEITESMLMQNIEKAIQVLTALKNKNIRLAIDDFGTGYSSLSTLKRFPLNTIKIDRSFIQDIPNNMGDKTLTKAIIAMGRSLNLTVIAEGVETKEQADFLAEHACDELQGYYFSIPVPADKFTALLQTRAMPELARAREEISLR
ncbi:putative bifunctional diguanylate cyclase/phosphodiesterase [Undibacterium arcticum]|uniref:Bifunctional diguanylate cyclase/phosphodiesterase n=1 Tax=Undibacterium arcticum TaxID=1762892 RepID=A0ABV7F7K5_9BURK